MNRFWPGKVVLVTGASAGLGWHLSQAFAQAGARVVLVARGAEALDRAAERLRGQGASVLPIAADITCAEDVARLIGETLAWGQRLDVLVNNAGQSARGALRDTPEEQFAQLMEINLLALARCTRLALPHLLASRGSVVNIGSLAAKSAARWLGAYPASKFAVAAYSQQLRLELAPEGLHVLLVCPGPIARDDATSPARYSTDGLPAEAARPGGGVRTTAIDPDRLARRVLAACVKRQAELIVPAKARVLFVLCQLAPRLGDWLVRRMT